MKLSLLKGHECWVLQFITDNRPHRKCKKSSGWTKPNEQNILEEFERPNKRLTYKISHRHWHWLSVLLFKCRVYEIIDRLTLDRNFHCSVTSDVIKILQPKLWYPVKWNTISYQMFSKIRFPSTILRWMYQR